ncbi:MAG: hypothetical protein ACOC7T_04585 [Planctomycetota bacterium]
MAAEAEEAGAEQVLPLQVLGRAGRLYSQHALRLLAVAAVGQGLYLASELISRAGGNLAWWLSRSLLAPGVVLHLWAGAAMILAVSAAREDGKVALREGFDRVADRFWWYAMAAVLYQLLWWLGLLLFLVFGLYWVTVYSMAGYAAVLEEPARKPGPLRRSRELVKGHFWRVFTVMLVLGLLVAVGAAGGWALAGVHPLAMRLFPSLWWILLWPFWTAAHVEVYRRLRRSEAEPREEVRERPTRASCALGCLLAVGLALAIAALLAVWVGALENLPTDAEGAEGARNFRRRNGGRAAEALLQVPNHRKEGTWAS